MSELTPYLRQRHLDSNGAPLSGGLLYSYIAGSSTPKATYTDETGGTQNTNPVELDADGYADVWITTGAYKFVLADANDVPLWTVDQVRSLSDQIAEQINVAGALAAASNLSDLTDVAEALENLGISPMTLQTEHAVTSGQSATNLTGETFDGVEISSADVVAECTQGTTVMAKVFFSLHYINSVWVKVPGETRDTGVVTGVTFSLSAQVGSVVTLKAAESGVGNATVKIKKSYFYV